MKISLYKRQFQNSWIYEIVCSQSHINYITDTAMIILKSAHKLIPPLVFLGLLSCASVNEPGQIQQEKEKKEIISIPETEIIDEPEETPPFQEEIPEDPCNTQSKAETNDSYIPEVKYKKEIIRPVSIENYAELIYNSMTLDEKIGQLFFISLMDAAKAKPLYHLESFSKNILNKVKPGGVILFSKNFQSEKQTKQLINEIKSYLYYSPFIGIDEEGGTVARLGNSENLNFPDFPHAREIGRTKDPAQAYLTGRELGRALKEWGFNINMAPVADINNNPDNNIIGQRSFGDNPELVARMCLAEMSGMQEEGIIPVMKHFPGHGDTSGDTHTGLVTLPFDKERLENLEWIPYKAGIENGLDVIMVGHLAVPAVTGNSLPATLSPVILNDILRKELNFKGLLISDAYDMGAIKYNFDENEAVVNSIIAGLDVILVPSDPISCHNSIKEAVKSGRIPMNELKKRVIHVLNLKIKSKIISHPVKY